MLKIIHTNNNISVVKDDETRTFSVGDTLFDELVILWKQRDFKSIEEKIWSSKKVVEKAFKDLGFTVCDGVVFINDNPIVDSLGKRIINYAEENNPVDSLIRFWERLKKNPSHWCVQSLFDFLDKNNCPIAEDGRFMAFKCVRDDFTDKYTGKIDNTPGVKVPEFDRNDVDDDKLKACSFGYHVGSVSYISNFKQDGDRCVEVLVDPADVVSIPSDVNENKMRVTTYEVVREVPLEKISYEKYNGYYNTNEDDEDRDICDDCGEYVADCSCYDNDYDF